MKTGHEIIEDALRDAVSEKQNFPFGMSLEQGIAYKKGLAAAYLHALEMIPDLQSRLEELNRNVEELEKDLEVEIKERDYREEVIDKILDMVLGEDRSEWSSNYDFEDAIIDVECNIKARSSVSEFDAEAVWDSFEECIKCAGDVGYFCGENEPMKRVKAKKFLEEKVAIFRDALTAMQANKK